MPLQALLLWLHTRVMVEGKLSSWARKLGRASPPLLSYHMPAYSPLLMMSGVPRVVVSSVRYAQLKVGMV